MWMDARKSQSIVKPAAEKHKFKKQILTHLIYEVIL